MLLLDRQVHGHYSAVLMVGVMMSAWFGGLGPGILASLLSALALSDFSVSYSFDFPLYSLRVGTDGDGLQLVLFSATAVMISAFIRSRHLAQAAADVAMHKALHDPLTGLPNRALIRDRLEQAILSARREKREVAVLLVDLDRFKAVNDTFGHHAGDLLLQQLAQRLRGAVRESDTVGRLGGDEFVVILHSAPSSVVDSEASACKLLQALHESVMLNDNPVVVGASIGIARYPDQGQDVQTLLANADAAMYAAKRNRTGYAMHGKPRVTVPDR